METWAVCPACHSYTFCGHLILRAASASEGCTDALVTPPQEHGIRTNSPLPSQVEHLRAPGFQKCIKVSHPLLSLSSSQGSCRLIPHCHFNSFKKGKGISAHCWFVFKQRPQHNRIQTFLLRRPNCSGPVFSKTETFLWT